MEPASHPEKWKLEPSIRVSLPRSQAFGLFMVGLLDRITTLMRKRSNFLEITLEPFFYRNLHVNALLDPLIE